ncbi:MAG: LAGLIDADG family homing endonuclease [Candidatus Aenigmatarchaeota archaeon]
MPGMPTLKQILPQKKEISCAKARIIAHLKGDGAILRSGKNKSNYIIKYEVRDNDQLLRFASDVEKVYGLKVSWFTNTSGFTGKPIQFVQLRSKLAYYDLMNFGKYYSNNWTIPETILKSSKKIKIEFLRAFCDDEGSVIPNERKIKIYSKNRQGLTQIRKMLSGLGIQSNMKYGFGADRNIYALIISDDGLQKFHKIIGFGLYRKQQKLKQLIGI